MNQIDPRFALAVVLLVCQNAAAVGPVATPEFLRWVDSIRAGFTGLAQVIHSR